MKKMQALKVCLVVLLGIVLSGCLTTEFKEYHITLNDDGSGKATIKFIKILSQMDDSTDVSTDDFNQLISDYVQGDALLDDFPNAEIVSKNLYEENGYLVGVVQISFDSLSCVNLYQFDKQSPYMFYIGSYSETYIESNGVYDENVMPVVFWDKNKKEIYLKTQVTEVNEDSGFVSLLANYQKWKK